MTNKHVVEPVLDQKTGTVRKGATAFVFTPALKDSGEGTIAGVMMAQIEQVFILHRLGWQFQAGVFQKNWMKS
jgi:hypothetical protein